MDFFFFTKMQWKTFQTDIFSISDSFKVTNVSLDLKVLATEIDIQGKLINGAKTHSYTGT